MEEICENQLWSIENDIWKGNKYELFVDYLV